MRQEFILDGNDFEFVKKYVTNNEIRFTVKGEKGFKVAKLGAENFINYPQYFDVYDVVIRNDALGKVSITKGLPKPFEVIMNVISQNVKTLLNVVYKDVFLYFDSRDVRAYYNYLNALNQGDTYLIDLAKRTLEIYKAESINYYNSFKK